MKVANIYKVNWKYSGCTPVNTNKMTKAVSEQPVCETTCNIAKITGDTENPYKEIVSIKIRKHHLDRFDKKIARKVSFTRAIAGFNKELRRQFWEMYLKTIKL